MRRRKNGRRFNIGYVAHDKRVNVIVRSQFITAYVLLGLYLLLLYSENYIVLPNFLHEIKFILGGLIIAWVLWHTINFGVSKHVIKKNR